MQKLFASDYDGTLHIWDRPGPMVSDADTEAILAFQAAGGLFGVCTGRPLFGLTHQIDSHLGFDFDFYIAQTGAKVYDRDRNLIHSADVPREVVHELYHRYAHRARPSFAGIKGLVIADGDYWAIGEGMDLSGLGEWAVGLRVARTLDEVAGTVSGFAMETVTTEEAAEMVEEINAEYGDVALAFQNLDSFDVFAAGATKGAGLRFAADFFGATLTAGIGDSFNDLPLIEAADVGYSFNACVPEMQTAADVLVDSAAEAIADFIRR